MPRVSTDVFAQIPLMYLNVDGLCIIAAFGPDKHTRSCRAALLGAVVQGVTPRKTLFKWQMGYRWVKEYIINEKILIILPAAIRQKQTHVSSHRDSLIFMHNNFNSSMI